MIVVSSTQAARMVLSRYGKSGKHRGRLIWDVWLVWLHSLLEVLILFVASTSNSVKCLHQDHQTNNSEYGSIRAQLRLTKKIMILLKEEMTTTWTIMMRLKTKYSNSNIGSSRRNRNKIHRPVVSKYLLLIDSGRLLMYHRGRMQQANLSKNAVKKDFKNSR